MKIIGVSQRLGISKSGELRSQIDTRLLNFISKCGYVPVPIPYYDLPKKNSLTKLSIWLNRIKLSGIVLSGGDDIGKYKLRDNSDRDYKWLESVWKRILVSSREDRIVAKLFSVSANTKASKPTISIDKRFKFLLINVNKDENEVNIK